MLDPSAAAWSPSRLVEALDAAARHAGLPTRKVLDDAPVWGATELDPFGFDRWVEASAAWLGIEAEPVEIQHAEVEAVIRGAAPALVRLPGSGNLLVLLARRGDRVTVLTPKLELQRVAVASVRDLVCHAVEAPALAATEGWLAGLPLRDGARARVARELTAEALHKRAVTRCYLIRMPPSADFLAQLRFEGVLWRAGALVVAFAVQFGLGLAGWYTLGSGAFSGAIDRHWLVAWALLLATSIPVQLLAAWLQADMLLSVGTLLKRRLLVGALRVDQDVLRRDGAGQLLGRALDANTLEGLASSGTLLAVLALVECASLAVVLALGPHGVATALAFAAFTALTLAALWRAHDGTRRWSRQRRDMTGDLLEQMIGHRTRLAQLPPSRWHEAEDEALDQYLATSAIKDGRDVHVRVLPAAWSIVGLATILPAFVQGTASSASLAVSVGAIALGAAALGRISASAGSLSGALIAWQEVKPLFVAAARVPGQPSPAFVAAHLLGTTDAKAAERAAEVPLVDAADIVFAYEGRPQPVLRGGSLRVHLGDRVLLEGPSGGGKSTFASILTGLRRPQSGLLLLEGLDWQTVGADGWRRRIASSPQFHDNHVLGDTLLFNLLMGRRWPPTPQDTAEAEQVCRELGLGDLLDRMPAGLHQMVGEAGWRLSHGECSRLYIARALLQDAQVVVLDEGFAALDPETTRQCLRCVLRRAPALVVIAHP